MEKSSSIVTESKMFDHWIPVPKRGRGTRLVLKKPLKKEKMTLAFFHWLTFAFKHSYELRSHGHSHIGDEASGYLLSMAQQVIAWPQEEIRQVGQKVGKAACCCCHIRWNLRMTSWRDHVNSWKNYILNSVNAKSSTVFVSHLENNNISVLLDDLVHAFAYQSKFGGKLALFHSCKTIFLWQGLTAVQMKPKWGKRVQCCAWGE